MDYGEAAVYLKKIYEQLNLDFWCGQLPKVTLTIQQKESTYGHFSLFEVWRIGKSGQHELNIAAGGLNRPIENIVATIIHESVHLYCYINGIQDTSNQGVYHNKKFKKIAEQHGLIIDKYGKYGYTLTTPSQVLIKYCQEQGFANLDIYRIDWKPTGKGNGIDKGTGDGNSSPKRKSSTRTYICPCCKKVSVRATKEVFIICGECLEQLIVKE